ncbi:MAG: hypothetical protein ACRBN8_08705 [Nannocystales bacterium]
MLERSARRASLVVMSLASTLVFTACGGDEAKPKATGASKASEPKAPDAEAKEPTKADPKTDAKEEPAVKPAGEEGKSDDAGAEGAAPPAEVGDEAGAEAADAESGPDDAEAGGEPAAEGGAAPTAEGGDAPAAEGGDEVEAADAAKAGGKDSAALIKEARTTKTTDERAVEALAEAETAGATIKELARAAKARGDYLYKSPDRAKVFYEWSAEKDENYADPVFALAKQKAVTGDVDDVVKLLKQVSERKGGKKLLEQIDFDPTWDIVKDDPDVRALL